MLKALFLILLIGLSFGPLAAIAAEQEGMATVQPNPIQEPSEEGGQILAIIDILRKLWHFIASLIVIVLDAANRVLEAFQQAFGVDIDITPPQDARDFIPGRINETVDKGLPRLPQKE
jgi:hypothetical protein